MSAIVAAPLAALDLETSGVSVTSDRIVTASICVIDGPQVHTDEWLLDPGIEIPDEAAKIHGITTERALAEGIALAQTLDEVLPHIEKAAFAVAHNISFDEKILGAEYLRLGRPTPFLKKPLHCTMKESTQFCALPGLYGFKYPNLTELHRKLFKKAFDDAHNALADVRACKAAYYELRTLGVMA